MGLVFEIGFLFCLFAKILFCGFSKTNFWFFYPIRWREKNDTKI